MRRAAVAPRASRSNDAALWFCKVLPHGSTFAKFYVDIQELRAETIHRVGIWNPFLESPFFDEKVIMGLGDRSLSDLLHFSKTL